MKKILIALIVWGAITFINIDLFASSYDDPVNNQGVITIDTQLTLLNNNSLRNVFESYVILPYNIISLYSTYTTDLTNALIIENDMRSVNAQVATQIYYDDPEIVNSLLYFVVHTETNYLSDVSYTQFYPDGSGIQTEFNNVYSFNIFQSIKTNTYDDDSVVLFRVRNEFAQYYSDSLIIKKQFKLFPLSYFGIENLSQDQLDYHYQLYRVLSLGFSPTVYYNQGSAVGYGNGLEDYHNGFYNYLDPTQGVPYNDGYDNGFIDGGVNGYNNGLIDGYDDGYSDGVLEEVDTSWILGFATGAMNVLGVSIIPGITLGVFVFIPLFFGFIGFIYRVGKKGG